MSKCGPQTNSITWEIWGNANIWTLSQPVNPESLGVGLGVSGSYAFYWLGSTIQLGMDRTWWTSTTVVAAGFIVGLHWCCGKEPA